MSTFTKKYNPHRSEDWNYGGPKWKLSRSKIDLFVECPRCFYLDNKLGTGRPRGPAFTLNVAVDILFKKEFDQHRRDQTQHPLMEAYAVDALPFNHPDLEIWRDNFSGITHRHEKTGFVVSGAVDDIWTDADGNLIVVDYKATSKEGVIETLADSPWEEQYRRQIGVYQWLLEQNGFSVSKTGYFVYANAKTDKDRFNDALDFETTLVPCEGETAWIPQTLDEIAACLNSGNLPPIGEACEFCQYREASGRKLQLIYKAQKASA